MSDNIVSKSFNISINSAFITNLERNHFDNVEMEDSFDDTSMLSFTVVESHNYTPNLGRYALGAEISFYLNNNGAWMQIFQGEIVEVNKSYPADEASKISIVCYDLSYRMKRKTNQSAVFIRQKIQDNVTDIVRYHGLQHVVIHPTLTFPKFMGVQSINYGPKGKDKTAWKALHRVATTFGYKIFVRAKTFFMVKASYITNNQQSKYTLVYNETEDDDAHIRITNLDIDLNIDEKALQIKSKLWTDKQLVTNKVIYEYVQSLEEVLQSSNLEELLNTPSNINLFPVDKTNVDVSNTTQPDQASWNQVGAVSIGAPEKYDPELIAAIQKEIADYFTSLPSEDEVLKNLTKATISTAVADVLEVPPVLLSDILKQYPPFIIPAEDIFSEEQAQIAALAALEDNRKKLTVATATVIGNALLQKGHMHNLSVNSLGTIGEADSGEYVIESVKHSVNATDGFMTTVTMHRPFTATKNIQGIAK